MAKKPPPPPTEAGPALDKWLAEWLMGWVRGSKIPWWYTLGADSLPATCEHKIADWNPSTSTALALDKVAEAMRAKGWRWKCGTSALSPDLFYCHFWGHKCLDGARHESKSAAVCLAASKARYAELSRKAYLHPRTLSAQEAAEAAKEKK